MLEEESDARRFSIHRLAHYCLDLAELMKADRVVPVVIFLRRARGATQRLSLSGDHRTHLDFNYLSCALGELSYEHRRDSDDLVARLNLPNIQYPMQRRVEVYARAVRGLTVLERNPEKQLKYLDFIDIYAALDDDERAEYQRDYPDEAQTMSRFAERFREEGMHQGGALVLERLLRLKFGALPDAVQRRIEQASEETLLTWSERVLTASRLDEVLH